MTDGNADNDRMTTDFTSAFNLETIISSLEAYQELIRDRRPDTRHIITAEDLNIVLEIAEILGRVPAELSMVHNIGADALYDAID